MTTVPNSKDSMKRSGIGRIRSIVAKATLAGVAAGALMIAGPGKAQAQEVVFGARAGGPFYARRDGFEFERRQEFLRRQEFERREAFLRHEEWLRAQRFHRGFGYR
jgi:guanyl-specific ribonuclease Sa